ncbi:acyl-CoA dehydrogenase family protein [Rhodoligotrophos defluvii]|uniref:acyl-CoA dehydrogenase family protein n=1 Tax=Rhodoligotrophos defluvii TaxID=2561934 RepID=UPI0010C9B9EE|nr:acyl-CoA dehydrogenase family protein [Rhodoligotrophos defluvii]
MDLNFSGEDEAFRQEVRTFVRNSVPPDMARRTRQGVHPSKADLKLWNRILYEKGWSAPHWPNEYGGTGWTPLQIYIFEEECAAADAPFLSYFGLRLIGPLIYTFGSDAQKQRYLDDILSGETFWCQGFSEPSAGSDLAAVKTTAVRDGDHYVINGQKLWTTEAHYADKMFCLARTNPEVKPQKGGLSILMFDMSAPGVTVRPIVTLDGGHSVNEVFLENVRVPAHDLLGAEGQGWDQAKFLLSNERVTNAQVPRSKRDLALLKDIAAHEPAGKGMMLDLPDIRLRIAQLEIDLYGLEWSVLRELFNGHGERSQASASGLKIIGSEIQQRLAELAADLVGAKGLAYHDPAAEQANDQPADAPDYVPGLAARQLFLRAATIYAGTNEIQRGIIAKQVFGM